MNQVNRNTSLGNSLTAQLMMARDALLAHQADMNTISHNVANVDTLGFHRQRTVLGAKAGTPGINGLYGSGVEILGIERAQVLFVSRQERSDASLAGRWSSQRDWMMRVEEALNEIGDYGIGSALDAFWNSWEDLANDSDSVAARNEVVNKAQDLGYAFASTYGGIESQRQQLSQELRSQADQINLTAGRIADLNQQITYLMRSGQTPNDLLDQRELLLKSLASLADISVEYEDGGAANVLIGSEELVHRDTHRALAWDDSGGKFVWTGSGREIVFSSGQVYGMLQVRDEIGNVLGDLDELADTIRSQVNGLHVEGIGLDGSTGSVFFRDDVSGARSLEVSEEIQNNVQKIAASTKSATGANDLAHAMHELQFATPWGDGQTISGKYQTLVSSVGGLTQNADLRYETADAALEQTSNLQQQYTGVNLDEEMSAMITAQYAFNAASKLTNTVEEMMNTVINSFGA